ncbi:MAG: QueT transporter family protein [Bacilli bacterium]
MDNKIKNRSLIERISINAMIASIYFILTMATLPVSFLGMQIRIAEMLILLCFFRKDFVIGVSVGTLLANTMSPMFAWDMLFGTLATIISGLLIGYMKQLFIAALIPVVINAFVVGLELHLIMGLPFWLNVGLVGLGEFIAVAILGYFIFLALGRNEKFQEMIGTNQNYRFKW